MRGRYLGIARPGPQQGVVDGEVPDLDLGERRRRAAHHTARGADSAGRARDGAWSMLGQDAKLVLAGQFRMLGDDGPPVRDRDAAGAAQDLDRLADEREWHRIAIGLEAHEIIVGHDARLPGLQAEAGVPGGADQVSLLLGEAINRALVRGPVDPLIGDLGHPLPELLVEVDVVDECPPRQEVPAEVLHPGLDFALRLGAIGLTQPRLEAPVVGEAPKRGVPQDPPLRRALADGARPVVEMLARVAAEILERALVRVQELRQGLVEADRLRAPCLENVRGNSNTHENRSFETGHVSVTGVADVQIAGALRIHCIDRLTPYVSDPMSYRELFERIDRLVGPLATRRDNDLSCPLISSSTEPPPTRRIVQRSSAGRRCPASSKLSAGGLSSTPKPSFFRSSSVFISFPPAESPGMTARRAAA